MPKLRKCDGGRTEAWQKLHVALHATQQVAPRSPKTKLTLRLGRAKPEGGI